MKKRKDSGFELPTSSRETSSKVERKRNLEVPSAKTLILKDIGYPFRIRGDPKPSGLEIDNEKLFTDYAREQWAGAIVRKGTYLFDRYVMPDFAFEVIKVSPSESIITNETKIVLETQNISTSLNGRKITLDDVIGHKSVKQKCQLILRYLHNPEKFGEWAPRASLFYGPPGTGKTLMAKAIAYEADASILLTKASDLIGTHVGDGGRRINALFEDARKKSPAIMFIDELDAIGLARSFQSIRGDVSEVVTTLLGEMDHTNEASGVVIIGATNAPLLIDSAIRSRFDSVFDFRLPDTKERQEILKLYAARLPLPISYDLHYLATRTNGLSGRDLRDRVLKEALHEAVMKNLDHISDDIFDNIILKLDNKSSPSYTI